MQGLFLLHSALVAASSDLLAIWDAATPPPGAVVDSHEAAVALAPAFQGYPSVVYEDAGGARHVLFNPPSLDTVAAWREGIDNPPRPTTMTRYAFSRRFHADEMLAILAAAQTDPAIQLFMQLLNFAENVDLTDPNVLAALGHLVDRGILTAARETEILTP